MVRQVKTATTDGDITDQTLCKILPGKSYGEVVDLLDTYGYKFEAKLDSGRIEFINHSENHIKLDLEDKE